MDDIRRTFDPVLREERRLLLWEAALRAEAAVPASAACRVMVTGSASRGQVHPWSDLDLVLTPTRTGNEIGSDERGELRRSVLDAADLSNTDVVFHDEIFDGLKRGMLGSLRLPADMPMLSDLPGASVALARVHVSIHYALQASASIMREYSQSEDKLRDIMSDFDRMSCSHAMSPLRSKAALWTRKLAVFVDGGRSPWLDDWDDEDALDRLLARLSAPGSAPDSVSSVIDASAAGSLRYLLVEAYDFVFGRSESEEPQAEYESVRDAVATLGSRLEAMVRGVPTHGLGSW
ncbi:hypothetical protein G6L37_04045 [Agrobacterium rubi]|nr:hypothetical protein [Agrobacterium rubi]NTF24522.1 hypothetical protein [Agrobacterium rubi]